MKGIGRKGRSDFAACRQIFCHGVSIGRCIHGSSQRALTRARRFGSLTSSLATRFRTPAIRTRAAPCNSGSGSPRLSTAGAPSPSIAGQDHSPRTTRSTHFLRARSASASMGGGGESNAKERVTSAKRTTPSAHASVSRPS
jgi:hypothetical protein